MKPKFQRKGGGRRSQSRDKLHEFMVSVQNFVQTGPGQDEAGPRDHLEKLVKRKSRKEMRQEKRMLKKMMKKKKKKKKVKPLEENKQGVTVDAASPKLPPNPAGAELRVEEEKKPKRKVRFEEPAPRPEKKAKVQATRKKALMEANEMEDREIKKLEKRLGLHKRRNKKSLPQSFISDGLDYILGILEPGGAELYNSEEEESDKSKRELEKLEESSESEEESDMSKRELKKLEESSEEEEEESDKSKRELERLEESSESEEESDMSKRELKKLEESSEEEEEESDKSKRELERLEESSEEEEEESDKSKRELERLEESSEEEEEEESDESKRELEKLEESSEEEEEESSDRTGDEEKGEDEDDGEDVEEEIDGEEEEEDDREEEDDVEKDEHDDENQVNPQDKSSSGETEGKYVPPHLREAADSRRRAELERLKRNLKGLINRLTEPSMSSISGQVEDMYMSNSRKDMNEALTEVLMAACVTPALLPDRLLMEHMLLVSVLHHTVGLEVGAHFLEAVVRRFDETQRGGAVAGKECSNLASMMAHLYNFQVVHSLLVFDVLKRLLESFTPQDVELTLLLLRNVGFSLRKDDPLGLKELISEAQRKASAEGPRFIDQTRVRFMLETMLALKNNDMRKIPGYDPEPVERLRKQQRSLIQNRSRGTDVKLRVSLENLLEAQRVGRWWIVGSSWSGVPMINEEKPTAQPVKGEKFSAQVLELARNQRMNTDVRRNIFCVIMTSEDYLDAFEKLLRLGLKGQQERDVVHVLLDCCLQEKTFNGFYAVLAEKFCAHDRRFQVTFQFCLWDKFKDLANLSSSSFANLVQMVTHLLTKNSLSLSILKAIEFGELDKPKVKFLRQIISKLLQQTEEEDLVQIFSRISGIPKLGMLREGLKLFIQHFLLRNAQTEETLLTARAEVAIKAMEARDAKLKL